MLGSRFAAFLIAILFLSPSFAAEPEAVDPRLQKALKRYPEADTDKDGKLSREEARAAMEKLNGGKSDDDAQRPNLKSLKNAKRRSNAPPPDKADVRYGSHPNNLLDLWLAESDKPTPLVVFIHGGGFVGGDKNSASGAAIKQCLDSGVSFASINYRFRTEAPINVVLRDTARAIQFLRSKSDEYNFDKTRVAAFGGSAGAGASLWLAFHDDLADPDSDDPVLRESSRLSAAASSAGQASYDIYRWPDVLGSQEAMRFYPESEWPAFYGLKTIEDIKGEEGIKLRADADMLGQISKDDPPVWLGAGDNHDALANKGDTNHSPKHSEAVKQQCDEVGVVAVLKVGSLRGEGIGEGTPVEFLLTHLGVTPKTE